MTKYIFVGDSACMGDMGKGSAELFDIYKYRKIQDDNNDVVTYNYREKRVKI